MELTQGKRKVLFVAFLLQLVWGLVPAASKLVIEEIPVQLYIALRWTISGLIFATFLTVTKRWKPIARKDALAVSTLGVLGPIVSGILFFNEPVKALMLMGGFLILSAMLLGNLPEKTK